MATRKRHTPEQVVRKLATADRMLGEGKDVADVRAATTVLSWPARRWPTGRASGLGCISSRPGEPWRNGYVESFNSRVRDECLDINIFWSLAQARIVITDWKQEYNLRRRHSSLGCQAPAAYAAPCTHR